MAFVAWAWFSCLIGLTVGQQYAPYLYEPGCQTCSAAKAYPCAHTIAVNLVEAAMKYLSRTSDSETDAWAAITNDPRFKVDSGFYIFAYDYDGPAVAHGANSAFVGNTLPQIVAMVNNPTDGQMVDDALQAGAEGDGWTKYDWTNNPDDPPMVKLAYTSKLTKWGKNFYIGVGYNMVLDEMDLSCTTGTASACAEKNTLILMGDLMSQLYTASSTEMADILAAVNNKNFTYGSLFYPFIYDYKGANVAHGANTAFVGMTLPEIVAFINNPSDGQATDDALQAAAEVGGSWAEYSWKNSAEEDPYKKIAYSMKFYSGGAEYYAGVGYNNVCQDAQYKEMATCANAPPMPATGEGGCADTTTTCAMVKQAYKASGCCGNPSATFTMGRRLNDAKVSPKLPLPSLKWRSAKMMPSQSPGGHHKDL